LSTRRARSSPGGLTIRTRSGSQASKRLAALATIGAIALLALVPTSATGQDVSDEEFDYAQTFRRSAGLPASDRVVADSFSEPGYSSERYGLPLNEDELRSLSERSRIRQEMQPAIREALSWGGYGGMYIDQEREGTAVFWFTHDLDERRDRLDDLMPGEARYEVRKADYTYGELREAKDAVARRSGAFAGEGIEIVEMGPDDRRNRMAIGVASDVTSAREVLENEFGPIVRVERASAGEMDCPRTNCRPMKGGLHVLGDAGPTDYCTSAFLAKTNAGDLRLVTAGHCMIGRKDHTWTHNGSSLGTAANHTLNSNNDTCGGNYCADAGWFQLDGNENVTDRHEFLRTTLIYSFDGVRHDTAQQVGDWIWRAGRTTDIVTGQITSRNKLKKTIGANGTTYWIDGVNVMDRDARGGDSGGPYWVEYDFAGDRFRMVAGIHSHSTNDTNHPTDPCEEDDNNPNVTDCRAWYTTADTFEDNVSLTICTKQTCP